jgi:hypothetical protein
VLVLVMLVVVVVVAMLPMPLVMVSVIFGFKKKKNGSGTDDWCMLLPLNPQAIFFKAPRNLTKATICDFYCCYR